MTLTEERAFAAQMLGIDCQRRDFDTLLGHQTGCTEEQALAIDRTGDAAPDRRVEVFRFDERQPAPGRGAHDRLAERMLTAALARDLIEAGLS